MIHSCVRFFFYFIQTIWAQSDWENQCPLERPPYIAAYFFFLLNPWYFMTWNFGMDKVEIQSKLFTQIEITFNFVLIQQSSILAVTYIYRNKHMWCVFEEHISIIIFNDTELSNVTLSFGQLPIHIVKQSVFRSMPTSFECQC